MKNFALLTIIVLCISCSQPKDSDNEIESIRAQLLEIAEMSALDRPTAEMTSEYMTYFSKEPTLLLDGIKILSNQYENPVIVVSDDMATRRYIGTAVFIIAGEEVRVTAKNRYVDILVKENGEWKMLWHSFVPVSWE
jgi:hypothetical protein